MSNEVSYPIATTESIIKKNAGVHRISHGAGVKLASLAASHIIDLATKANTVATHAGRTTIREEDIDVVLGLSSN